LSTLGEEPVEGEEERAKRVKGEESMSRLFI